MPADSPIRPAQMVVLFTPGLKTPVFHAWGKYQYERAEMSLVPGWDERLNETSTPCGLLMHRHHWAGRQSTPWLAATLVEENRPYTAMRFDNASLFGRPCRRCFPDGGAR